MKPKTILLLLLATVSIARANLIDLTPGGWDTVNNGLPPVFFQRWIVPMGNHQLVFFDSADPEGWNGFGALPGGTNFFTTLIGHPGPFAGVSWDFSTLPGWSMSVLLIEGEGWLHLYAVPGNFRFIDSDLITLNGDLPIQFVEFAGRTNNTAVPDGGGTLAMMGIGLLGLAFYARRGRTA